MASYLDLNQEQRLWTIRNDHGHYASTPDDIHCPWCDTVQQLDFEDVSYKDDDTATFTCWVDTCGKEFDVHTSVSYDWHTERPEEYLIEQALKEVPNEPEQPAK